ncbi:hypothetical protein AVEN_73901-1 [Araneus ventricosus]|uniref:Uncharacterized protein n=1 Tax=Araneus ventricosus TaxID=182803 RepID=A0A4Y2X5I4_ARAVE|nr:hypothetical protein AVEN_73901-1 [Araneus ventricosus]
MPRAPVTLPRCAIVATLTTIKLGIHHKAVPIHLEGFLADRFHFQPIKFVGSFTGRTVPLPVDHDCANLTYEQPDPLNQRFPTYGPCPSSGPRIMY